MKRIPKELINKPNAHPMTLDRANIAHARGNRDQGPYRSACNMPGQPVTLAQALAWAAGWCSGCYEQPRAHGGH